MISVAGYTDLNLIHQSLETRVFSARSTDDDSYVTLKCLRSEIASPERAARYKQEFELLKSLDSPYIIKAIKLIEQDNCPILVLERFNSPSLFNTLRIRRLTILESLNLCKQVTLALDYLHTHNVIHKHLSPENILYLDESKEIKLIDFEIAGHIDASKIAEVNNLSIGTLNYVSPEQTGRVNRTVDYRTDFYSMGALFYELLTGQVPFQSNDPMQLVYFHIARQATPPAELNPKLPGALNQIALKLLEKNPEDRYQSTYAIEQDLSLCIKALTGGLDRRSLETFTVALDDIPEQLNISEKLLERGNELNTLNEVFKSVSTGESETVICIGPTGSGKSALVREFRRHLPEDLAYFIQGRQNIINSSVPYSALTSALRDLCRLIISQNDTPNLEQELTSALGSDLPLLSDIVPEVASLINYNLLEKPNNISPLESRKKVARSIAAFLKVITGHGKNIVLYIENLQWIDEASIEMLQLLAFHYKVTGLMIIGSYRLGELDQTHSTRQQLTTILSNSSEIKLIELVNLNPHSIATLISESLFRSKEDSQDLANTVHLKTGGNPLAIREFLTDLQSKKILYFDREYRDWNWDNELALKEAPTNNMGEILARNFSQLDSDITDLLQIASCIGERISLSTLQKVSDLPNPDSPEKGITRLLTNIVRLGYLSQCKNAHTTDQDIEYEFSHERIQQVAYSFLSTARKNQIHSRIGHYYLERYQDSPEHNLFEMVNQLNNSFESLIPSQFDETSNSHNRIIENEFDLDRIKLAKLNIQAGREAKKRAAFQASFKYLRTAIALYGQNIWERHEESFDLHKEAAEVAHLCGDRRQHDLLVDAMISHSQNNFNTVRAYEARINALVAFNELADAQALGHEALGLLGIPIHKSFNPFMRGTLLVKLLYLTSLMNVPGQHQQPNMIDEEKKAGMRLLTTLCQIAYLNGDEKLASYILKMTELSLKHGLAPESSFAYPLFGAVLITYFGTINAGYRFGLFAMENLNDDNRDLHCKTITVVTNFINIWKHPYRDSLEPLTEAYKIGMETGDVEFALIAAITSSANAFVLGNDLNSIYSNLQNYNQQAKKLNQLPILNMGLIYQQAIENLAEPTEKPWEFNGPIFEEKMIDGNSTSLDLESSTTNLYILKLFIATLFHQNELALTYLRRAREGLPSVASSTAITFFTLYESLSLISNLQSKGYIERTKMVIRLKLNQQKLRKWSQHAPQNILHALHLVEAEFARYNSDHAKASTNYEQAIYAANQYGFIKEHAFACELAGMFYISDNKHELALFHLRTARASYLRWGAMTKVRTLDQTLLELGDERYPGDQKTRLEAYSPDVAQDSTTQSIFRDSSILDFETVLKATQALSGEIILGTLIERLMEVALENAGALSASLILKDKDQLYLEIQSVFTGPTTGHQVQRIALDDSHNLPVSIIQYVARTKDDIVLNNALKDDIFTQDKYLLSHNPKSILCVPILSKSHLTGVLYLENSKSTHTFTKDRVALLKLLAAQAAIAIENAKLYQQLNDSRNKYVSLYENAVEGIFEIALDSTVRSLNPAAKKLIGFNSNKNQTNSMKVDPLLFFVSEDSQTEFMKLISSGEAVVGFETKIRRIDNREIWVVMSAHLVMDENSNPLHVEGSIIDITERKMREEAEQEKRIALAAADTKSRFLANMSHEIRTPMNAIIGYTNLALTTELNTQQKQYLSTIQNSSVHLLRVVNDILDISRVESGNLELQKVAFRIADLFEDVSNLFNYDIEKQNLEFILPKKTEDHLNYLLGDPARISQVLINLVSNALKFTDEGSITINLETLPLQSGSICLNFSVKDTGIGIENANIESIFDSFTQAQVTPGTEGSGLGLSISKRLVEMMQGHIHAVSEVGIGSNFYFSVVVEPWDGDTHAVETEKKTQALKSLNGQKILLVEDNEINLRLAKEVLQNAGYNITTAVNGEEALNILNVEVFFAVLMDLRMPIMDGNEAIKRIRAQASLKRLPAIALSAGVLQHEVDEALQNGFDHYISKPVDFDGLLTLLNDIAGIKDIPRVNLRRETYRNKYHIRGIEFDRAIANHDNDEELFKNLSLEFIKIYQDSDQEFQKMIEVDSLNTDSAERLMHNVAGVAGNFGGINLMEAARAVEHQLMEKAPPSPDNIKAFSRELENFVLAIHEYHALS